MSNVFISYSRKDTIFARRLYNALTREERTTWADWEGIPYSVDFWEEIKQGIDAAEVFVCIISPDSMTSMICNQEVAYARANNKRILPIMHRDVDERTMAGEWFGKAWENSARDNWLELKRINWLSFSVDDNFDQAFQKLLETIDHDPENVRFHTRMLVKAREWEAIQDRNLGQLLRGEELQQAEAWLLFHANEPPKPTDLHRAFIQASIDQREREALEEKKRQQRLRVLTAILSVLLVFALIATGIAINRTQVANDNADRAATSEQQALSDAARAATSEQQALANADRAATSEQRADGNAATAVANADLAATSEQQAVANADLAATSEQQALINADRAATSEQQALANADRAATSEQQALADAARAATSEQQALDSAEIAATNAQRADESAGTAVANAEIIATGQALAERRAAEQQSLALAVNAQQALSTGNTDLAVTLILESVNLPDPPIQAQRILSNIAYGIGTRWRVALPSLIAEFGASTSNALGLTGNLQPTVIAQQATIEALQAQFRAMFGSAIGQNAFQLTASDLAYSPDGASIAVLATSRLVFLDADSGDERWSLTFAEPSANDSFIVNNIRVNELGYFRFGFAGSSYFTSVAFSPNGRQIIVGSLGGLRLVNSATGTDLPLIGDLATLTDPLLNAVFLPDGIRVLVATPNGLRILNTVTGETTQMLAQRGGAAPLVNATLHPDGTQALAVTADRALLVWDLTTDALSDRFANAALTGVNRVIYSADHTAALTLQGSDITLWDLATGDLRRFFSGHSSTIKDLALNTDGSRLVSVGDDNTIILWDYETGQLITRLRGHTDSVSAVAFSPDGATIVSGSRDGTIRLWDVRSNPSLRATFNGVDDQTAPVVASAFSPDGQLVATASTDGNVRLWDVGSLDPVRVLRHDRVIPIRQLTFSPDGTHVLGINSGSADAVVWDITTGEFWGMADVIGAIWGATYTPDGTQIAMTESTLAPSPTEVQLPQTYRITLRDATTGAIEQVFASDDPLFNDSGLELAFSPNGQRLYAATIDGSLIVWDVATGEPIGRYPGHRDWMSALRVSPDGTAILTGSDDTTAVLWDAQTGAVLLRLSEQNADVLDVDFSPDGTMGLVMARNQSLTLYDLITGDVIQRLSNDDIGLLTARWSPDGRFVVGGYRDGTVVRWSLETPSTLIDWMSENRYVRPITCQERLTYGIQPYCVETTPTPTPTATPYVNTESPLLIVYGATWNIDGTEILSRNADGTVRVWDAATGAQRLIMPGHTDDLLWADFSPDQTMIVTANSNNTARVWSAETGALLHTLGNHLIFVDEAQWSVDGAQIYTGDTSGVVNVWDSQNGALLRTLDAHFDELDIYVSPDGTKIATTSDDGTAKLWDATTWELLFTLNGHTDEVQRGAWSPDGLRFATVSVDGTAIIWEVATGELLERLSGHTDWVLALRWSPNGRRLATASADKTLRVWDTITGDTQVILGPYDGIVTIPMWSADGTRLLVPSFDGNVRVVDSSTGALLLTLPHGVSVYSARWSPDERQIVTGAADGLIRIWDATTGALLLTFPQADSIPTPTPTPTLDPARSPTPTASATQTPTTAPPAVAQRGENRGILATGGTQRWFFDSETEAFMSIGVNAEFDTTLKWFAEDGTLLAQNDDFNMTTNSLLPVLQFEADTRYIIEVGSYRNRSRGAYVLTIGDAQPNAGNQIEGEIPGIGTIFPDATTTPTRGKRAVIGENDSELPFAGGESWTYSGQAGEVLQLELLADWDTVLFVYAPNGMLIAFNDDISTDTLQSRIDRLYLEFTGDYQIEVRGFDNVVNGPYTLLLTAGASITATPSATPSVINTAALGEGHAYRGLGFP